MRKAIGILAFTATFLVGVNGASASSDSHLQFRNSIRTLEDIQDATAAGDPAAADLQAKLTAQIEADVKNVQQSDLQDINNLRALAIYLFSGAIRMMSSDDWRCSPLMLQPRTCWKVRWPMHGVTKPRR